MSHIQVAGRALCLLTFLLRHWIDPGIWKHPFFTHAGGKTASQLFSLDVCLLNISIFFYLHQICECNRLIVLCQPQWRQGYRTWDLEFSASHWDSIFCLMTDGSHPWILDSQTTLSLVYYIRQYFYKTQIFIVRKGSVRFQVSS